MRARQKDMQGGLLSDQVIRMVGRMAVAAAAVLATFSMNAKAESPSPAEYMYAGTWNNLDGGNGLGFALGVYGWRLNADGSATSLGLVAKTDASPDNLEASTDGRTLYATNYNSCICTRSWPFPGGPKAGVSAYHLDPKTGRLTFLNRVDGLGDMPSEIATDKTGHTLILVNYYGGNVVTFKVRPDGRLGKLVDNIRHEGPSEHSVPGPHPHGLAFSPDNHWFFYADQGLDRVYAYRFDATHSHLIDTSHPYLQFRPGTGPRTLAVHPNGKWIYVNTEQEGYEHVLERESGGGLHEIQSLPIFAPGTPNGGTGTSRVSPDGRFLYVNQRPNEDIVIFSIDQTTGRLTLLKRTTLQSANAETANKVPFAQRTLWEKIESGARAWNWDDDAEKVAFARLGENSIVLQNRDEATGDVGGSTQILPVPQPSYVLFVRPQ